MLNLKALILQKDMELKLKDQKISELQFALAQS